MNSNKTPSFHWQRYAIILLLAYIIVYLIPLGERPIMIPDESRYAEIPREMISNNNWVSPHLNGLRYFEKPVLGYWLTAASISVFGENAFAVRLPSALAAGLSAFSIFLIVSSFTHRKKTAVTAAMIYLSMFGVFLIGTFNILDSAFSCFLTLAFVTFYYSHQEKNKQRRLLYLILLGVFCGAAFLTKGFLAFVLLAAVIFPYVIWQGRWQELFSHGWIALVTAVIVIAPWSIMIHLQEPDYWHYFFWEEHIKRFASDDAQHSEPFWFYFLFLPLLASPWIPQIPFVIKNLWRQQSDTPLLQYALLWLIMPFIFFSIARGKLPTYILPCMAPLAILLAIGIENTLMQAKKNNHSLRIYESAITLLAIVFAVISLLPVLLQNNVIGHPAWLPEDNWKWLSLSAAFFSAAILLMLSIKSKSIGKSMTLQASSLVAIMLILPVTLPQRTIGSKMPGTFLLQNINKITPDTLILSDDTMIHAVNWYYKRTDVYMTGAGESRYGLSFEKDKHRLLEGKALKTFIAQHLNHDPMVIIHHSRSEQYMATLMPPQAQHSSWGRFVLWYIPVTKTID